MFLSDYFPVKVSRFTMFLDYKKVDYDTKLFFLSPHVICARMKKKSDTFSNDRY